MKLLSKLFGGQPLFVEQSEARRDDEWKEVLAKAKSASESGQLKRAIQLYDGFLEKNPSHADAFYKRGVANTALGHLGNALTDYDRAIALNQRHAYAFCNRGSLLERMDRKEDAVRSFDMALSIKPDDSLAHFNRGTVLKQLGRPREALASFDQSIQLAPDYAEAYVNRGNILQEMWRHQLAILDFEKAIELKPIFAEAFQGRGTSQHQQKQYREAIESYSQALALNPRLKFIAGMRRYVQMQICDWTDFDADVQRLALDTLAGIPVCPPFAFLTILDDPSLHRLAANLWIRDECTSSCDLGPIERRTRGPKIRVGYFSADFRTHPVAQVTVELFEQHDRDHFELTAFSFGPPVRDVMRTRLERSFDRFIDVQDLTDVEIASLSRKTQIDIAVDLGGYTESARPNIFVLRAAPIQISFLGYPGTIGADFIDYLIADRTVVPEPKQVHYSEKIIYLPQCYLPSDSLRPPGKMPIGRTQMGLPESAFVFCCFNHVGKLIPGIFASWMRILKLVEGSVLWLAPSNPIAVENLCNEAEKKGITPARLIFARRIDSTEEHRARLACADLFLDTSPYNAHVTALDALSAGLPILTLIGEAFAGRVAASLLHALGLPELIATNQEQYEELAVRLAHNPSHLGQIRAKVMQNRAITRDFDVRQFKSNLDIAYCTVFDRYLRGQLPDHIYVEC